ncbi:2-phosphosulfolactate phosphatase [Cetobacterium sp. SF1]|uniref:2-phosphosulfolactate phosphatase n=1 Tax=unclassified Cetobacterium TaxID=2630983 RepID=UPI003CEA7A8A
MKVTILASAKEATKENTQGKTAIVIDVLRATSVMITALENGAKRIYPFSTIEETIERSKSSSNFLLSGERNGLKVDGFDLGNSPLDYTPDVVRDKEIFMTTSNGTRAIENSKFAKDLFIASYLNITAITKKILELNNDTVIVCAGTNNEYSLDDMLCAGLIVKELTKFTTLELPDFSIAALRIAQLDLPVKKILAGSKHFEYLKSIGYERDLYYCCSRDNSSLTPKYTNGIIER